MQVEYPQVHLKKTTGCRLEQFLFSADGCRVLPQYLCQVKAESLAVSAVDTVGRSAQKLGKKM